jgi:uncharacterized membrane protein (UPF0127 family)
LDKKNNILDIWEAHPGQTQVGPTPLKTQKVIEVSVGWPKRQRLSIGDNLVFLKV